RAVAGQFAAEHAAGDAPVVATVTARDAQSAADREGVRHQRLGDEIVVLGGGQLLHADRLLVLAGLDEAVAELVAAEHVEELAVAGGVVADRPVEVAGTLAL